MILVPQLITRFLPVLAIVFVFSSCLREDESLADKVKIIAHRGYHLEKLENTTEAFQAALNKEYKHLELDICFTKDFIPVVLHDNLLDGQSDTTGLINDMNLADLKFINLTGGYQIPILDTLLHKLNGRFETLFIDLKQPCSDSSLINLAKVINKHNAYSNTITTCMNPDVTRKLKSIDGNIVLGTDGANNGFEDNLNECIEQKYKHILVYLQQLDKHLCYIAHANDIKIYAYTPNTQTDMLKALNYDIDGIMTGNPDLLKQIIE